MAGDGLRSEEELAAAAEMEAGETSKHLGQYQEAAVTKEIQGQVAGDWITLDGRGIRNEDEVTTFSRNTDGKDMAPGRLEQVGTFNEHSGVISFVDQSGQVQIGARTPERLQALQDAGYKRGTMEVPLTGGGEKLANPTLDEKWQVMKREANEQLLERTKREHEEVYRATAEKRGVKAPEGDWLDADGIKVKDLDDKESTVPANSDGRNMTPNRMEQMGRYAENNGHLALVGPDGHIRVAPKTPDRLQALADAGYKRDIFGVPLSDKEKPVDERLEKRWAVMKEAV